MTPKAFLKLSSSVPSCLMPPKLNYLFFNRNVLQIVSNFFSIAINPIRGLAETNKVICAKNQIWARCKRPRAVTSDERMHIYYVEKTLNFCVWSAQTQNTASS